MRMRDMRMKVNDNVNDMVSQRGERIWFENEVIISDHQIVNLKKVMIPVNRVH